MRSPLTNLSIQFSNFSLLHFFFFLKSVFWRINFQNRHLRTKSLKQTLFENRKTFSKYWCIFLNKIQFLFLSLFFLKKKIWYVILNFFFEKFVRYETFLRKFIYITKPHDSNTDCQQMAIYIMQGTESKIKSIYLQVTNAVNPKSVKKFHRQQCMGPSDHQRITYWEAAMKLAAPSVRNFCYYF